MTENDLFNRDTMYWRDINYSAPTAWAELELVEPYIIDGEETAVIFCRLLPFESGLVEYEMEDGGAFTKNEVLAWPYVLQNDLDFYLDESNSQTERDSRLKTIEHKHIKSITLRNKSNVIISSKAKI